MGVLRGCFIGVDRYADPSIAELSSAKRDAVALHALFSDNLAGSVDLLCDEAATSAAVTTALTELQRSDADDVVVISFSGHGTSTHELVTHDADVNDLAASCISLDALTELIAAVPARQLICILDCCFSGGAGAKVLNSPRRPRSAALRSVAAQLEELSGTGRLILTASAADEPAWEDARLGHGLLTYALLEALQGAETVKRGDRVPIYSLLSFVVDQVRSGAATHGARQTATLRGQIDGEISWPVFTKGPLYRERFPEFGSASVTKEVGSLEPYGFPEPLLAAWGEHVPSLNQLQQDAINDYGLLNGDHLLVSAPTSSGKTLLGELAALRQAAHRGRSVFLLPTRALVNDKYDHFAALYAPLGVRVIRATGEIADDVPALLRGQFDIALLTYEKFTGLLLAAPHLLRMLALIVIDELQTITDSSRGSNLEFLLTLIRSRRAQGIEPQVVMLSAVLGDVGGLDSWLSARYLRHDERPVPLQEGVVRKDGTWRYVDIDGQEKTATLFAPGWGRGSSQDTLIPLISALVGDGKKVIVFRNQRGLTRGCARYLAGSLGLPPADEALAQLPAGDLSGASNDLRHVLRGGVAFHNAELDRDEKLIIERQFRDPTSTLRVIVATTTLAQGINSPAEAVVIAELDHPAGRGQSTPYTVAEYKNIVGRAGRLGFATSGQAFLLVDGPVDEDRKWRHYVLGVPEDVRSTLLDPAADTLTLVLRVLAAATPVGTDGSSGMPRNNVVSFLSLSFAAHQATRERRHVFDAAEVNGVVADLLRTGLAAEGAGAIALTELGRLAGAGMVTARTVLRLADFFSVVPLSQLNRAALICAAQATEELDAVQVPTNARGWQKERATYGNVLHQQGAGAALDRLLQAERGIAIRRIKRAVGCLLWMDGASRSDIDAALTRHLPGRDGAAAAQAAASRTRDVIDSVLQVAQLKNPNADLTELSERLPVQLELGVPEPVVPLARVAGQQLRRVDYLQLHAAGLAEPGRVLAAPEADLLSILGGDRRRLDALRDAAARAQDRADDVIDITSLLAPPEHDVDSA
jgi:helicase